MIIPPSIRFVNYQVTFGVATCSLLCNDDKKYGNNSNNNEDEKDEDNDGNLDENSGETSCGGQMKIECEIGNPMRKGQKINVKFRMDGSEIPSHTSKGEFCAYWLSIT